MIHCEKCLALFTNSVGSGTVLCNGCQPNGDPDIFDTQPTCGELSCDECNERYKKALSRISALEAERDRLKELLKEYMETCGTCDFIMMSCDLCAKTKASIGGEEQP